LDETALGLAVRLAEDANRNESGFLLMGSLASESGQSVSALSHKALC